MTGGCFVLFVGWLFFNAGSSFSITEDKENNSPQLTVINTILAAAGASTLVPVIGIFSNTYS